MPTSHDTWSQVPVPSKHSASVPALAAPPHVAPAVQPYAHCGARTRNPSSHRVTVVISLAKPRDLTADTFLGLRAVISYCTEGLHEGLYGKRSNIRYFPLTCTTAFA